MAPADVFNHPAALAHPLRWALIHGASVLTASAAGVIAWRLNEEQALKDSLTGLPNRRLFCDRVEHSLAREARRAGTFAVLFIDLDRFKDVNDTLGHPAGDQLLVSVAERLRVVLRPDDTAARFGGDEFALLVEEISADSGRPSGLEALLRWRHPTPGLLAPGEFLASAEDTGAIVGIGTWALQETRHPGYGLGMSVNLSPIQLFQEDVVEVVADALASSGLRPERLTLEITEDVMVRGSAAVVGRLDALKALGITLAVDDFGTGYSSLAYLRRLPFDVLKIDKTFVDDIARGDADSALARAIVKLGQTLGLVLVAEGVEHPYQVARLRALGSDLAQGYWFGRPAPAEALEAVIGGAGAVPAGVAPG